MRDSRVSRRAFLSSAALMSAGVLAAACQPKVIEKPVEVEKIVEKTVEVEKTVVVEKAPTSKVVVQLWWGWGGANGMAGLLALCNAFNQETMDVAIESLAPPGIAEKYTTAIAGGTPPDLAVGNTPFSQLAARGALTPLDDFVNQAGPAFKDDFFQGAWASCSWRGKIYGVLCAENGPRCGILYNLDLIEEAGLDIKNPPQTWEELYDWHVATTKVDSAGNALVVGCDVLDSVGGRAPGADYEQIWVCSYGFSWWDGDNLQTRFDDERYIATLEQQKKFNDLVGVEQMGAYRQAYSAWTASPTARFPSRVEAMILDGYWSPTWIKNIAPDIRLAASRPPVSADRKGKTYQNSGGHPASIPVGAKHPNEAFRVIQYFAGDRSADLQFATNGFWPARASWISSRRDKIVKEFPILDMYFDSMLNSDELWPCPVCPIEGFITTGWYATRDKVLYGEMSAAEACREFQKLAMQQIKEESPTWVS
ncbi:MAG: extracellular solute-binding protein [Anaerolineae bacterium]